MLAITIKIVLPKICVLYICALNIALEIGIVNRFELFFGKKVIFQKRLVMKFVKATVILGCAVFFTSCSQTASGPNYDDSATKSSSSKKGDKSSSSKEKVSSSSFAEDLDEDCVGEIGNAWDGTTAKKFACGAGTKLSPYIILTAEQLAKLSFIVGANETEYQGKYYKLGADIILNEGKIIDEKGALVADSAKLHKWTPIGNSSVAFTGNFDGDGHTVSGMFINTTSSHNGLFGNNQGNISNLILKNSWVSGGKLTAGIAGSNGGSITQTTNFSSIIGNGDCTGGIAGQSNGPSPKKALISSSANYGIIKGKDYTGGIAGQAYQASVEGVENHGLVEGNANVGGIAGRGAYTYVSSYFMDCKNAKNFADISGVNNVGGIIGGAGYVSYTISTGNILAAINNTENEGNVSGKKYVGGIAGTANKVSINNAGNKASVEGMDYVSGVAGNLLASNSSFLYNTGNVSGSTYVGGIIGYNSEGVTSAAYSTGKVDGDSLVGLMIGYNYNTTMADYYYLEQGEQEPFGLNNGGGVATPKTSDEMKSEDFAELLGDEFVYDSELNDGYPILKWEEE